MTEENNTVIEPQIQFDMGAVADARDDFSVIHDIRYAICVALNMPASWILNESYSAEKVTSPQRVVRRD